MQNITNNIQIVEVGPRDGFQNVTTFIPTQDKIAIIEGLIQAGVTDIQLTSFVSPKAIPQLADAAEVCWAILEKYDDKIKADALIPNLRGAKMAWAAGIREVAYVISVSEAHNKANINRTHEESLQELEKILHELPDMKVHVDLGMSFACPFIGWVDIEQVAALALKVTGMGIRELVLCDSIGVATPDRVYKLSKFMQQTFPEVHFSMHLHDTRGMGIVNTIAGIEAGIYTFETAVGGLGGCPFAPGAAGNTATEDVVSMLQDMKVNVGIDQSKLLGVVGLVQDKVDAVVVSHMSKARIYDCL